MKELIQIIILILIYRFSYLLSIQTELNLKGNRLEILEPSLLSNNEKLKKLDVSHNRLTEIHESYFSVNK